MLRHAVDLAEAFCRRLDGVDEPVIHLETGRQGGNQHVLSYRLRIEVKRNHRGGNQCGPRMAEPFAVDLHTVIGPFIMAAFANAAANGLKPDSPKTLQ